RPRPHTTGPARRWAPGTAADSRYRKRLTRRDPGRGRICNIWVRHPTLQQPVPATGPSPTTAAPPCAREAGVRVEQGTVFRAPHSSTYCGDRALARSPFGLYRYQVRERLEEQLLIDLRGFALGGQIKQFASLVHQDPNVALGMIA